MNVQSIAVFGGSGFIGSHLAEHVLRNGLAEKIYLVDRVPQKGFPYTPLLNQGLQSGQARYIPWDVRQPISRTIFPEPVEIIFNFAAVHREPGHRPEEYFETNLLGAENVCAFAAVIGCSKIVFTSSISPYGPSEAMKNELSIPTPDTAYGSSKLAAEKIHLAWQAGGSLRRKLLILRPGVVFGPGEGGNVTRLIRSLVKGYFVYMGNRETRKAAGYVKELCQVMQFGLDTLEEQDLPSLLLNFSLDPAPTMEEFVSTIQATAGIHRPVLSLPRRLLVGASYPISALSELFGIKQPINPVRVRKLFRSTNIEPLKLRELSYQYRYTLDTALSDWKLEVPEDFEK